jgi:hypothetical protein
MNATALKTNYKQARIFLSHLPTKNPHRTETAERSDRIKPITTTFTDYGLSFIYNLS